MGRPTKSIFTYSDGSARIEQPIIPLPPVQYYMHLEDKDVLGGVRSCAPCPAVFTLKDEPHAVINKQWQFYIRAINYNMALDDTYFLLDCHLAFANNTGFRCDPKADFFHNKDLQYPAPNLDKVRTCSRSILTGVEQFSLVQSAKNVQNALWGFLVAASGTLRDVRQSLVGKNVLKVSTFDSQTLPPLKLGRSYPTRIEDVNPDDYLYLPETNREMFLTANIVNKSGELSQFPRGALYPWFENGKTTGSFFPHISNHSFGDILYPLSNLAKLPLGSPVPSPYRRNL